MAYELEKLKEDPVADETVPVMFALSHQGGIQQVNSSICDPASDDLDSAS